MKYDARKLSTNEQALLRRLAAQQVLNGELRNFVTVNTKFHEVWTPAPFLFAGMII